MKNLHTNRVLTVLALLIALALSGCVSKRSYDRDVSSLLNKLEQDKGRSANSMEIMESKVKSKAAVLSTLTGKYTTLEKDYIRARERLNSFNSDLQSLKKDIAELKLVVSINIDKLRSTVANEMLIKIIDMEYRIGELLKKESEPVPEPSQTP
jgi:peptidoglycan hydrolase CwlO-like protein